jgi:predicted RNA methylase
MNERWTRTEALVNGIVKVLNSCGITSGNLLDLCCGNGRISVHMAKKGFRAIRVDISKAFLEDARKKAREYGVMNMVTFLEGDVRRLKEVVGRLSQPFDVVVNAWTSIGFYSEKDDLGTFKQVRELSREGALLFITETMHTEYLSIKFTPTSYTEIDNIILLESRKYDPVTSQMNTCWTFYNKRERDLDFMDKAEISHYIYSLCELSSLLKKAGWETIACYGSLLTLQAMNPLTSLNIVAKAC